MRAVDNIVTLSEEWKRRLDALNKEQEEAVERAQEAILHAATNKSRMERSNTNDYKQSVTAEANLRDMAELLAKQRQEKAMVTRQMYC